MIHRHHRKRRSQGGDDSPGNIILLPQEIHAWVHDNPEKAYELGWLVRSFEDPQEISIQIPEELVKIAKRREKREKEAPRRRAVWSIRAPADSEQGVELLEDLTQQARERLVSVMGWQEDVGSYYVLMAVLSDWLNTTPTTEEE